MQPTTTTTTATIYFYKFSLHKGLVRQIGTKLVEAGQDEHENIIKKNHSKLQTRWKTEKKTLYSRFNLEKITYRKHFYFNENKHQFQGLFEQCAQTLCFLESSQQNLECLL